MDWDDVRIFLAVARKGSLTGAGTSLGMSASSVSRHIEDLESRLGVTLFLRSQSGYALGDAGLAIIADAERAESAFDSIRRNAPRAADKLSGTVRVALPDNLATSLILPEISSLLDEHDEIVLEAITSVDLANLTRREADIALRLVRPEAGNVIVSRVARMSTALYASSDYLAKRPFGAGQRGGGHFAIGWDEAFQHLKAHAWLREQLPLADMAVRTTTLQSQLAACVGGAGLSALPCFMADPMPTLKRVMEPDAVFAQNIWLVVHRDINAISRIRVVAQFLRDTLRRNRPRLLGETAGASKHPQDMKGDSHP